MRVSCLTKEPLERVKQPSNIRPVYGNRVTVAQIQKIESEAVREASRYGFRSTY